MNTEKINTPNEQEAPLLITAGMVPSNESLPAESPVEAQELIEVPEELKATPTERQLGHFATHVPVEQINTDAATGLVDVHHLQDSEGRFGMGKVPVENPGATSFIQADANGSLENSQYSISGRQ